LRISISKHVRISISKGAHHRFVIIGNDRCRAR